MPHPEQPLPASKVVMDSVKNSINPYTLVGATFGIGKTSLSIDIASVYAQQYLDDPDREDNYIPVFAPLKDSLDNINEKGESLEDVLGLIAPAASGEARKKKIVVLCDGLDEYGSNIQELKKRLDILKKQDKYPNTKFVITTRLEANIPEDLKIGLKTYIRLLPFSKNQVDDFFRKSNLPEYTFERFKTYGGLEENTLADEMRKPLFCWMFVLMINSDPDDARILEDTTAANLPLRTALIYQEFIHSVIRGKYKEAAEEYFYTKSYPEQRSLLRKIAALKQMYDPEVLKETMVVTGLGDYYGLKKYNKEDLRRNKIVTSYFYLKGTSTTDKTVGFIHKSFFEHLLAEYYIESITLGYETAKGLLALVNSTNESFKKQIDTFVVDSLQQRPQSDLKKSIIENAKKVFEAGEIILQKDKLLLREGNEMWLSAKVPPDRYSHLWIHRWLSLFILNSLAPDEYKFDKQILSEFIAFAAENIPGSLKRLAKVNLSQANLSTANLREANLSDADLSGANLTGALLSRVDLSTANLSGALLGRANLSQANLSAAFLSRANLSQANLYGANLSGANLSEANLSRAYLSGANLSEANLSRAYLYRAYLSGANLSGAYLSEANLSRAYLYRANLSGANLSKAYLRSVIGLPILEDEAKRRGAII
jgi:uncharacterized protein YjbI with pentapeptide repeats